MSRITALSYLGIEASDLPAWRRFSVDCLGMDVSGDDALTVRFDDHAARLFVTPGDLDDLAFAGFEVATDADLETIAGRATARHYVNQIEPQVNYIGSQVKPT